MISWPKDTVSNLLEADCTEIIDRSTESIFPCHALLTLFINMSSISFPGAKENQSLLTDGRWYSLEGKEEHSNFFFSLKIYHKFLCYSGMCIIVSLFIHYQNKLITFPGSSAEQLFFVLVGFFFWKKKRCVHLL